MSLCGDGRPARPAERSSAWHCPTTNLAKFLHLQVLMWPDLLNNYTTFGAGSGQATIGFSGSGEGLFLDGAAVSAAFQATNSEG